MIFGPVAGWTAYRMHTPKWAMSDLAVNSFNSICASISA
jgi:hypothetical protein